MKMFFKKHIGLIIFMILVLLFPVSLSNQAKLNMKVIVTGLAIDKVDDEFEVTAQIVKNTPGTESPGASATMEFITDKAKTISLALANLSYRSGKVAAYSHTNFIILGDSMKNDAVTCLDYFVRDQIVKSSTMILFSKGSASEEIQKTKNVELSVGLNLQKVFLFKERESDALMVTVMQFLKHSKTASNSAFASTVVFKPNETSAGKDSSSESSNSGGGGSESSGSSGSSESSSSGSGNGGQGSAGSSNSSTSSGQSSSGSGGSGGSESSSQLFETQSPIYCFKNGKFVMELSGDEFLGYILMNKKTLTSDLVVENIESEKLAQSKASINIKHKSVKKHVRFENGTPVLDLELKITNGEVNEIVCGENYGVLSNEEYEAIKKAIRQKISELAAKTFASAKQNGIDVFGAYDTAYKFSYDKTKHFDSPDEFLEKLKFGGVTVIVAKLDS